MHDRPSVPNVFRITGSAVLNASNNNECSESVDSIINSTSAASTPQTKTITHSAGPNLVNGPRQSQMQHNRLTTTASIERNCSNVGWKECAPRPQVSLGNGQLRAQFNLKPQQQQQNENQHQQQPQHPVSGVGVINTVSGSSPSTRMLAGDLTNSTQDLQDIGHSNYHRQKQGVRAAKSPAETGYRPHYPVYVGAQHHNTGYLWLLTPVAASISVAIVIAALAGPQWLYTEEKLPNANYNGTANFNVLDDGAFITKYTKSSLWILCSTLQGVENYNCIKIDYFPKEGYQPDPLDSTPAIPYTVMKSCPLFLAAGIFLVVSFIVFLIPTCSQQNSLYYFSAGIMFIVSGLLMLIGLITYISILKSEIGSKLRPRSTLQPPLFKVTYGQSFFLFVIGFVITEFVGLLNIFLYISLQEVGYYSRLPCLTLTSMHNKVKEDEQLHGQTYKSFVATPPDRLRHKQVHSEDTARARAHTHAPTAVPVCRKHPDGRKNGALTEDLNRRYYFESPPASKCNLHSHNLAKSLNELCMEPAAIEPPPPPPPLPTSNAVRFAGLSGRAETFPRSPQPPPQFADPPFGFPLTRSVSTTTDIFCGGREMPLSGVSSPLVNESQYSLRPLAWPPTVKRVSMPASKESCTNHKAVSTQAELDDGDNDEDSRHERLCGLKRGIRKTKDELFHEFCKRAGVRPKPKNIYYVASEEEEEEAQQQRRRSSLSRRSESGSMRNGSTSNTEAGLRRLQEAQEHEEADTDDQVYIIENNDPLANSVLNSRRASMFAEPVHLRKLNSNLSLHSLYPAEKSYQRPNFVEQQHYDSAIEMWPTYPESYYGRGSQNRLQADFSSHPFQSRTLPRTFLKSNTNSQNSLGGMSFHSSASALHNAYSASQSHLQALLLHQQQHENPQQAQQSNHLLPPPREHSMFHPSPLSIHKSCENIAPHYPLPLQFHPNVTYAAVNRHAAPTTPLTSRQTALQTPTAVHWPSAIPSSPSNYSANLSLYAQTHFKGASRPLVTRTSSGSQMSGKFQRGFAFDEQLLAAADTFDLDELERERRRSHASLFNGITATNGNANANANANDNGNGEDTEGGDAKQYDLVNGTAV